jgi:hypothetical protein
MAELPPRRLYEHREALVSFNNVYVAYFEATIDKQPDRAYLEQRAQKEAKRRRNPFYWADRALRAILGIPSYILSQIFGVPVARIDQSPWGMVIRLIEVAAAILGIYWGGSAADWW